MLRWIVVISALVLLLYTASTADGACDQYSLPCDNGQCVPRGDWCDGKETCDDGSDEAHCKTSWWGLNPNKCDGKIHFKCEDGRCWPQAAHCDGIDDCRDASDEDKCDVKHSDESDVEETKVVENEEKSKETSEEDKKESSENGKKESKESSEETKKESIENGKKESNESSEENKKVSNESPEENENESNEISEENGIETTTQTPTATTPSDDDEDYEEYEHSTEASFPPTTTVPPPLPSLEEVHSLELKPEPPLWPPTTEMDFYAKKMEQSDIKRQSSTQTIVHPTSAYRSASVRPSVQYPSRRYTTSRRPAVPHTGPTRVYTPRPYRYIGAQYTGQTSSQYRDRYPPVYHPSGYRSSYHPSDNNYIPSHSRTGHQQQYRNNGREDWRNGNNGREDWRNGVTRPPRVYGRKLRGPSRFYFKKNYNEVYSRTNYPSVRRGVDWIRSIRNDSGGWGKETPRALVALSLVNNSFLIGNYENDLMQKYFQVHLAVNLLKDKPVSLNRLAMFVNALIATCQDPRDFQGWDLTELIRDTLLKLHRGPKPPVINPLVYLSLCLADRNLTQYEVHHLMTYLAATRNDEATRDMRCLALEAFACHMQKERPHSPEFYTLQKMVWNATSKILDRKKDDGSFGSVYSTALAVQALLSVNETRDWNPDPTFRFLKNHQQRNGSFGDFLATYQVLPALSGRSLVHLRNTDCNPPRVDRELSPQEILQHPGPKSYIRYSLHLGSPLSTGYTVQLLVPTGISFFDVMRVAAHENDHFKFSYEEVNGKTNVYSISDIPNDPEEGLAWRLYVRSPLDTGNIPNIQQLYTGDIKEFLPTPDQHVIFWYHPLGF